VPPIAKAAVIRPRPRIREVGNPSPDPVPLPVAGGFGMITFGPVDGLVGTVLGTVATFV